MTDRPIIFSGPMIRALLDGRKTMTRRLAWGKPKPVDPAGKITNDLVSAPTIWQRVQPGDRIWVKESVLWNPEADNFYFSDQGVGTERYVRLKAEWGPRSLPSIFMYRWASRLTLIVVATKIERLQDISDSDAQAEGVEFETADPPFYYVPKILPHSLTACEISEGAHVSFGKLWNHLHGKDAWQANPEVVAISFTAHAVNIDAMGKAA